MDQQQFVSNYIFNIKALRNEALRKMKIYKGYYEQKQSEKHRSYFSIQRYQYNQLSDALDEPRYKNKADDPLEKDEDKIKINLNNIPTEGKIKISPFLQPYDDEDDKPLNSILLEQEEFEKKIQQAFFQNVRQPLPFVSQSNEEEKKNDESFDGSIGDEMFQDEEQKKDYEVIDYGENNEDNIFANDDIIFPDVLLPGQKLRDFNVLDNKQKKKIPKKQRRDSYEDLIEERKEEFVPYENINDGKIAHISLKQNPDLQGFSLEEFENHTISSIRVPENKDIELNNNIPWNNGCGQIDRKKWIYQLIDSHIINNVHTVYHQQYDTAQFNQFLISSSPHELIYYWKNHLKALFNVTKDSQIYALTSDKLTDIIVPNVQKRNITDRIIELFFPGFPYVVIEELNADYREKIDIIFNSNKEKDYEEIYYTLSQNYQNFEKLLKILTLFIGRKLQYDRIWISFEIQGYGKDEEKQSKNIALSLGVPPESSIIDGTDEQFDILWEQKQENFIQQFLSKTSYETFGYTFIPLYIDNIQIFLNERQQKINEKILINQDLNNDLLKQSGLIKSNNTIQQQDILEILQTLMNIKVWKYRKQKKSIGNNITKDIQNLDNFYSIFHQQQNEPCLYTLYRFHKKIDIPWDIMQFKIKRKIKNFILKGNIHCLLQELYKEKLLQNFGIYFYYSNRWINSTKDIQYIIIQNHIIISSQENVERLVYTNIKKKTEKYELIPTQLQKKKKKQNQLNPDKQRLLELYFDFECYTSDEKELIPYLGVFYSEQLEKKRKIFWGDLCVLKILRYLNKISDKYEKIKIWTFNGSKFDYNYLWKKMIQLRLPVQIYGNPNNIKLMILNNISFQDIRLIFNYGKMKDQAILWGISQTKFDFDIANKSKKWFEKTKKPIIYYCIQDCIVLMLLVQKFYNLCSKINYKGKYLDYQNIFTASQLSLQIYQQLYQPCVLKASHNVDIYKIESESYFGGMTQMFRKWAQNLYYYDINSSYPNVLNYKLFPIEFLGKIAYKQNMIIKEYFLYEVELEFYDHVIIPYIPQRKNDGLYYCLKIEKSWRWGVDILFGQQNDLIKNIKIYQVIKYTGFNIFSNFIDDIYKKRLQAKQDKRIDLTTFYKLVLNSLYGKFGQKQYPETKYFKENDINEYIQNYTIPIIKNEKRKFLNKQPELLIKEVESLRRISKDIYQCSYVQSQNISEIYALKRIASIATRYACIELMKGIINVGMENVVYCDTDSIMCTKELNQSFIHDTELGKWKLEKKIPQAFFCAPKLYYLDLLANNERMTYQFVSKGIISNFQWKNFNGNIIDINNNSRTQQQDIDAMIQEIFEKKQITIINKNQFVKKNLNIYVIPVRKIIKLQNKKRLWTGILSEPLYSI